jgi:4-hydroxythreonine-4-phosphate dehydrogenase
MPVSAPLAVTMGDPAGIGPDILLTSWVMSRGELTPFAAYADPDLLRQRAAALGMDVPLQVITTPMEAVESFASALPVVRVALNAPVIAGYPDRVHAAAVVASIDRAVAAVQRGEASAVVTNPIAKHVLYAGGFKHPGHTEYLGELAARHWPGLPNVPVMMLVGPGLRVVPLTVHIPLAQVPGAISHQLIIDTAVIMIGALRRQFGIAQPRIAVAGLNPHAGEDGTIGTEETTMVRPAVDTLRAMGHVVTGPHSADTLFHAAARETYDAVLCMYHDQALIPLKTIAFDDGVNVTIGLPFVRTSPDHGTAFDIAGSGRARPNSLVAALKLAAQLAMAPGTAS